MNTSFQALHEETRPLALLDRAAVRVPPTRRGEGRRVLAGALAALVVVAGGGVAAAQDVMVTKTVAVAQFPAVSQTS